MNAIIETINAAGRIFVEFALPMFIQSSVLVLILLLVDTVLRRRVRAVFRYWIWMLVLLKLVLPPSLWSPVSIGTWLGETLEPPAIAIDEAPSLEQQERPMIAPPPEAKASPEPANWVGDGTTAGLNRVPRERALAPRVISEHDSMSIAVPQAGQEASAEPAPHDPTDEVAAAPPTATPLSWQALVLLVWLAIALALLLLLIQRAWFVRGLIAQAQEGPPRLRSALDQCRLRMHVMRTIPIRVSPNATSPAVCGLFRPSILIPKALVPRLQPHDLQAVLLHELAHIKRGDLWVNLIQTLLQIIYFYNPFLWLANVVIRRVREQAVDEAVLVAMGETARDYPETLLNVARLAFKRRPALSLRLIGVVESKSALRSRIKHILARPFPETAKLGLLGLTSVCLIAAVLLPMARARELSPSVSNNGPLDIRLLGICPDGDGELYDANGNKLDVTLPPLGTTERPWERDEMRRDFVFEMPDVDGQLRFVHHCQLRPAQANRVVGVGYVQFNPLTSPPSLVVSAKLNQTYPKPWGGVFSRNVPVQKVDLTLSYFFGQRGEALCTFTGPFTEGTTVQADEGRPYELKPESGPSWSESQIQFRFTTSRPFGGDLPVIVYDTDGRRYLVLNKGGSSGSSGARLRCHVDAVPWDRVAAITVGEQAHEITFRNIVVDYPERPQRTYPAHLGQVGERLNLAGWLPDDLIQSDFQDAQDVIAVLDVVRGSDLMGKVAQAIQFGRRPVSFAALDPAAREKIRKTAAGWLESPYRMMGIMLGLVGHWPEFFDLAMASLQSDCPASPYYPEYEEAWLHGHRAMAAVLQKYWGPLSASEVEKLKGCIRGATDGQVQTRLFRCLSGTKSTAATNAYWELAQDERPWIWWHATEMWHHRASPAERTDDSLPEEMKLKLDLVMGSWADAETTAKASALLVGQLTPELCRMSSTTWDAINNRLSHHFEKSDVTGMYLDYLRQMRSLMAEHKWSDAIISWNSAHVAVVVRTLNLWYDTNIGNLGSFWTQGSSGQEPRTFAALEGIISDALAWHQANPDRVPRELPLEGRVVDETGHPIANAQVTLTKHEDYETASGATAQRHIEVGTCRTEADGRFTFTGLGRHRLYTVDVIADGFMPRMHRSVARLPDGRFQLFQSSTIEMQRSDSTDEVVSDHHSTTKVDRPDVQIDKPPIRLALTERAGKVMPVAEQEARRLNHSYVGTEHILLALARQKDAVSAKVLANLGADLGTLRAEVNKFVRPGAEPVTQRTLPYAQRAGRVMQFAEEEARSLGHEYIGTEHILLGLMRERESVATRVLANLSVTSQRIKTEILRFVRPGRKPDADATDGMSESDNGEGAGGGALAESDQAGRRTADDEDSPAVVAELPSGVTLELLGICEHPLEGKPWWRPDGSALDDAPYDWPGAWVAPNDPNALAFELALRVRNLPEGWKATVQSVGNRYSNSEDAPYKAGQRLHDLRWLMIEADPDQTTCAIRCNITEPWQTMARSGLQIGDSQQTTADDVVFSAIQEEAGPFVTVVVSGRLASLRDEELRRIVAVPKDGAVEKVSRARFYTRQGPDKIAAYFSGLSLAQIEEFQFQTRARTSILFEHVSLRPEPGTTVGIRFERVDGVDRIAPAESRGRVERSMADVDRKPFCVRGRVTDESGQPMEGVAVNVDCGFERPQRAGRTLTDKSGRYTLHFDSAWVVSGADPYGVGIQPAFVYAQKEGYYETSLRHKGNLAMAGEAPGADEQHFVAGRTGVILVNEPYELNFVMAPAALLTGELIGANGRPVSNRDIYLHSDQIYPPGRSYSRIRTHSDGTFGQCTVPCTSFRFFCPEPSFAPSDEIAFSRPGTWRLTLKCRETGPQRTALVVENLRAPPSATSRQDLRIPATSDGNDATTPTPSIQPDGIGSILEEPQVGIRIESERIAGTDDEVVLPDADREAVMLDLASGQLVPIPRGASETNVRRAILDLGRGDLVHDGRSLILVRGATIPHAEKMVGEPFSSCPIGESLPQVLTVTTAEKRCYEVTILAVDQGTSCTLRCSLLSTDEKAGEGMVAELPNGVTVEFLAYSQLTPEGLTWWTPQGQPTTIPNVYEADVEGYGGLAALRIEPEPEAGVSAWLYQPPDIREELKPVWQVNGGGIWLAPLGDARRYANIEVMVQVRDPVVVRAVGMDRLSSRGAWETGARDLWIEDVVSVDPGATVFTVHGGWSHAGYPTGPRVVAALDTSDRAHSVHRVPGDLLGRNLASPFEGPSRFRVDIPVDRLAGLAIEGYSERAASVRFRNLSLRPGQSTDVQVEVAAKEQGPWWHSSEYDAQLEHLRRILEEQAEKDGGRYPADLSTLQPFFKDMQWKWVQDHVVYLGAGKSATSGAVLPLAYEKRLASFGFGTYVLHSDGDVKFNTPEQLQSLGIDVSVETSQSAGTATNLEISGQILDPDGEPAVGAQVAWIDAQRSVSITDGKLMAPRSADREEGPIVETDGQGRFRFEDEPNDGFSLVAAHETGFALVGSEEWDAAGAIRLERWGRIEGHVAQGRQPEGDKIWMSGLPNSTWFERRRDYRYETLCDSEGRFTFERVPPGWFEVGYLAKMGDFTSSLTSRTPVVVEPGRTAKVQLGGEGRPVVGKFVPPSDWEGPVYFGAGLRALDTVQPERPVPDNYDQMTRREQQEWIKQWYKTPEAGEYREAAWHNLNRRHYTFRIEDDGTFRIEDVIPGEYRLTVWLEERFGGRGRPEEIGGYSGTIEVPPMDEAYSDEPLDAGDFVLTMRAPLHVGDMAPLFEAQTLDGKDIRLADYRGRFVLLNLWSPVFNPELDRLKELHETYRDSGKLQIIGLGGTDTLDEVKNYVEEHGIEWPEIYFGPDWEADLLQQLGGQTQIMLIDPDGKIIATWLRGEKLTDTVRAAVDSADLGISGRAIAPFLRSYEANGLRFEAGFKPDKSEYVWGEPMHYLTYVVRNTGDKPLNFVEGGDYRGGRSESHAITAVDANGLPVPVPAMPGMGGIVHIRDLLPGQTYTKSMPVDRRLTFGGPGVYEVTGRRTLRFGTKIEKVQQEVTTENRFELTIHPYSPERMGQVIAEVATEIENYGNLAPKAIELTEPEDLTPANRLYLAFQTLVRIEDEQAVDSLIDLARQAPENLRAAAVRCLGRRAEPGAMRAIKAALNDPQLALQNAAAEALGTRGTDEAVEALIDRFGRNETELKVVLLKAMGRTRSPKVMNLLSESLNADDRALRRGAIEGLVAFGSDRAIEILKTCVGDPSMDLREMAVRHLAESLKQPIDPRWLVPVIESRKGKDSIGDAPRVMRLYTGERAVPALLSCLDFDDPSIRSYYSQTIISNQGACQGGLRIPWISDLNRDASPEELEHNQWVLRALKTWVDHYYAYRMDEEPLTQSQYWQELSTRWGEPVDGIAVRARCDQHVWPEGMPQVIQIDVRGENGGSIALNEPFDALQVELNGQIYERKPLLTEPTIGIDEGHGRSFGNLVLDEHWQSVEGNRPMMLMPGQYALTVRLSMVPEDQRTGLAASQPVQFEVIGAEPFVKMLSVGVSGQVLGPDGKPVAGATVTILTRRAAMEVEVSQPDLDTVSRSVVGERATTDARGGFHFDTDLPYDSTLLAFHSTGIALISRDAFTESHAIRLRPWQPLEHTLIIAQPLPHDSPIETALSQIN